MLSNFLNFHSLLQHQSGFSHTVSLPDFSDVIYSVYGRKKHSQTFISTDRINRFPVSINGSIFFFSANAVVSRIAFRIFMFIYGLGSGFFLQIPAKFITVLPVWQTGLRRALSATQRKLVFY